MRSIPILSPATTVPQEHVVLCRAYGAAQERCSRIMAQQQAEIDRLQAQVLRLRAAVVVRDTALALERGRAAQRSLEAAAPKAAQTRTAALPLKARLRAWQWLQPWWRQGRAVPEPARDTLGVGQRRARLAATELLGCQGSWLGPGVDWPG
ncbi:MAG: hypothetical protein R3E55_08815 [Burkholderiaceae bacterium]